jgi:hypothetical protein
MTCSSLVWENYSAFWYEDHVKYPCCIPMMMLWGTCGLARILFKMLMHTCSNFSHWSLVEVTGTIWVQHFSLQDWCLKFDEHTLYPSSVLLPFWQSFFNQ